jgi:hypothetical protein
MKKIALALITILLISMILTPKIDNAYASDPSDDFYGYIVSVDAGQDNYLREEISKLVNNLLKEDIEVFWIADSIRVVVKNVFNNEIGALDFEKGSFIIPFKQDADKNSHIMHIITKFGEGECNYIYKLINPLEEVRAYQLVKPKIAIHCGEGVDYNAYEITLSEGGFPEPDRLNWDEIPTMLNNDDYNIFIWGGADEWNLLDMTKWTNAVNSINDFINSGGGFVGSCILIIYYQIILLEEILKHI